IDDHRDLHSFPTRRSSDLEPKYSIAKAFKLILPEVSQTELPLALPYPKHEKLKDIVSYLEHRIHENISFKMLANEFDVSERTLRSEEHTSELQSRENLVCR